MEFDVKSEPRQNNGPEINQGDSEFINSDDCLKCTCGDLADEAYKQLKELQKKPAKKSLKEGSITSKASKQLEELNKKSVEEGYILSKVELYDKRLQKLNDSTKNLVEEDNNKLKQEIEPYFDTLKLPTLNEEKVRKIDLCSRAQSQSQELISPTSTSLEERNINLKEGSPRKSHCNSKKSRELSPKSKIGALEQLCSLTKRRYKRKNSSKKSSPRSKLNALVQLHSLTKIHCNSKKSRELSPKSKIAALEQLYSLTKKTKIKGSASSQYAKTALEQLDRLTRKNNDESGTETSVELATDSQHSSESMTDSESSVELSTDSQHSSQSSKSSTPYSQDNVNLKTKTHEENKTRAGKCKGCQERQKRINDFLQTDKVDESKRIDHSRFSQNHKLTLIDSEKLSSLKRNNVEKANWKSSEIFAPSCSKKTKTDEQKKEPSSRSYRERQKLKKDSAKITKTNKTNKEKLPNSEPNSSKSRSAVEESKLIESASCNTFIKSEIEPESKNAESSFETIFFPIKEEFSDDEYEQHQSLEVKTEEIHITDEIEMVDDVVKTEPYNNFDEYS